MKAVSTRVMSYGLLLGHMNAWMALADDVEGRMRHKSFENHERKLIQGIKRLANCVADGEVRHSKMPEASQVFNLPGACDTLLAKCNGIIEQVSSLQIDRAKDALKPCVAKLSAMKGGIPDGRDWKKEAKQAACLSGHPQCSPQVSVSAGRRCWPTYPRSVALPAGTSCSKTHRKLPRRRRGHPC